MGKRKYPKTEWGIDVTVFMARYGMSLKDLCEYADVREPSLQATMIGKTPGVDTIAKVDAYMTKIESEKPPPAVQPFTIA